jgi:hypothetical protein
VDIAQRDFHALVGRNIDAGNARHGDLPVSVSPRTRGRLRRN